MVDDFEILQQLGQDGAQGIVYMVEFPNGLRSAMKQFKPSKSKNAIRKEAEFQTTAAEAGIAPAVMHVDVANRRIFMEPMASRVVDILERGTPRFKQDVEHIMHVLDDINILHNDGNALNLMLNEQDELRIIDFGLAKKITAAVRKKWQGQPNIKVTLFMLKKGLAKYKIKI